MTPTLTSLVGVHTVSNKSLNNPAGREHTRTHAEPFGSKEASGSTRTSVTMAAATAALSTPVAAGLAREFQGLKASTSFSAKSSVAMLPTRSVKGKGALGARADYIGSATNLIVVGSTTLFLIAGRFGLAPSANRKATAGLALVEQVSGLQTGDPAGFTLADTLAFGALGHIFAVGLVLGLKATGGL